MNKIIEIVHHIHILNAWLFVIPVWLLGIFIANLNRKGMKRATDMTWYKLIDKISSFGSLFSMISFLLISLFIPLQYSSSIFFVSGLILLIIGGLGHFAAKIAYSKTDQDEPVNSGIYKFSRNPMYAFLSVAFLGAVISSMSIFLAIIWIFMTIFTHLLIIGEERYCLSTYGESYKNYMKKVSRYLFFF